MNAPKQQLKDDLTALGYSSKQVSIAERRGGLSYSFILTIRDASVNAEKIEAISRKVRSVSVCERTGETLSGGNTYVRVVSTDEVLSVWAKTYRDEVVGILLKVGSEYSETGFRTEDGKFCLFRDNNVIKVWSYARDFWIGRKFYPGDPDAIAVDMYLDTLLGAKEPIEVL